jgi:membrane-associated phospholipid phosphatase
LRTWICWQSALILVALAGCQGPRQTISDDAVAGALAVYRAQRGDAARIQRDADKTAVTLRGLRPSRGPLPGRQGGAEATGAPLRDATIALAFDVPPTPLPTTQRADVPPAGYWRKNVWHQMGHEAKHFGGRDLWRGFKTSFWDVDNALVLTATLGASITIRESGLDHAIRNRTDGNRQLGDFDEPIQLLGHPATHFAGTGVLWLTSALTKDTEQHEVARSLAQALCVNGLTTLAIKATARTDAPNGDQFAFPSGHTSSAFTVAAVLNEYYGPWVGVPSLALAGLVGYQRIDSRVHDFSDVIFGGMMGYVIGTSIAREEKARFPELFGMTVLPFSDPETGATGLALYGRM